MNLRGSLSALLLLVAGSAAAAPVLMISIDGMKPEYVLQAKAHGLKVPFLESLITNGAYADGVIGVWPTVTYPSHTTLVTGVDPAEHGILANVEFDPNHRYNEAWYWYAAAIRVPTLWQAAHAKGLLTASIGWPVTVGATGIDYLIPEYWRTTGDTDFLNPSDRHLLAALTIPSGLLADMKDSAGPYMKGNDTTLHGDDIKTKYAVDLLRRYKPRFMTVHLSSLDDAEHDHGVFSPEANQNLEALDTMVSALAAAAHANDPATLLAVVSDHGFTQMHHEVNLYIPFIQAGLMTLDPDAGAGTPTVSSWLAQPWLADGMAPIMLQAAADHKTRQAVAKILQTLAADPENGIAAIKTQEDLKPLGAFPDAAFLVVFKPGFDAGENMRGSIHGHVQGTHGDHGFSPEFPDMRASFFITGNGIARHRDLGTIDMRQIAPTIARLLGVTLPDAKAAPLLVEQ